MTYFPELYYSLANWSKNMDFAKLLRKTDKAVREDQKTFNAWFRKEITTEECIKRFKENNKIKSDFIIDVELFEYWLYGLGYRRK